MTTGMKEVKGSFHDRRRLDRAVYALGQHSVPSDSIRVQVVDERGRLVRRIGIEREAGTFRGALIGAGAGALLGGIVLAVIPLAAFGVPWWPRLGVGAVVGALSAIVILAIGGLRLGGIIGMGHWRVGKRVSDEELEEGAAWVIVESDEMADVSRRVLRDMGAERLSG
jgi:hypothetical protein